MVESVRLIEADEDSVVRRWVHFQHRLCTEVLPSFGGRVVKKLGDGILAEFTGPEAAVAAAFAVQALPARSHGNAEEGSEILLRVVLDAGEVMLAQSGRAQVRTPGPNATLG